MKYLKNINLSNNNKKYLKSYYKLLKNLDIGDFVAFEVPKRNYFIDEDEVGEIINISDTQALVFFKKNNYTIWVKKEYIVQNSKLKKDIEDFIKARIDSKKYNL